MSSRKTKKSAEYGDEYSQESNSEHSDYDDPIVTDWSKTSTAKGTEKRFNKRKQSVVNFDRAEVASWEEKKVSELNTEELLKVLIRRGEIEKRPTIAGDCKITLKKINFERIRPRKRYKPFNKQKLRQNNEKRKTQN